MGPTPSSLLDDQKFIFTLRCEMNYPKLNFKRNIQIIPKYCINECIFLCVNTFLTWCEKNNAKEDLKLIHLPNKTLE